MKHFVTLSIFVVIAVLFSAFFIYTFSSNTEVVYSSEAAARLASVSGEGDFSGATSSVDLQNVLPQVTHVKLPVPLKAIYMTSCVAGTPSLRERVVQVAKDTEVNSIMIDVKDYSGTISFDPGKGSAWYPAWENARCGARDMKEFIDELHKNNIFVIARITVFQDPYYVSAHPDQGVKRANGTDVWKDRKGISFVDVGSKQYWNDLIALAASSYALGFDEINFDYIRYPSDGNMSDISFPLSTHESDGTLNKAKNLELFFQYLHEKMSDPKTFANVEHSNTGRDQSIPWTSADLFGMTTTAEDDMNIGQILEVAFPYFNFIAPMVYPSHYPASYAGLSNPNADPYKVVHHAMNAAVVRGTATTTRVFALTHNRIGTSTPPLYTKNTYDGSHLRTWIQDFDYGGDYGPAEVRAQIKASEDAGVMSWMIWAPSNVYTKEALHGE